MRARLAIAASGQPCQLREVVLRNKPQALIDASPKATVPVLVLADGTVIEQSLEIMLWALGRQDPQGWLAPQGADLTTMLALIQACDERFKPELDRYKYPQRYEREQGGKPGLVAGVQPAVTGSSDAHQPTAGDGLPQTASSDADAAHRARALVHRAAGARWIDTLQNRLARQAYLFGERVSVADMAIAPFVRQFAHVDKEWFEAQPWPAVQAWLHALLSSDLFARVMAKYPPWVEGTAGERFP